MNNGNKAPTTGGGRGGSAVNGTTANKPSLSNSSTAPTPNNGAGGLSYDLSSFADPLQAQALQLTASAGLMQSPLHNNNNNNNNALLGLQPIAPAGAATGTAPGGVATAPLQLGHHHPATAHLSAFLSPGSMTNTAVGQQHVMGGPGAAMAAGGHPGLLFSAAGTPGVAQQTNPNAAGAAAIALIMQQLQHAGVTASPLLLQQLAGPLVQAAAAPMQQQQQQQQQPLATLQAQMVPGMAAQPVPSSSVAGAGMKDETVHASKRPRTAPASALSFAGGVPFAGATSSSTGTSWQNNLGAIDGSADLGPPKEASQEELQKMKPAERRRYERNLREQQRSYRISQQIKELRDVLAESNVPYKPNKYSILLSVVDYIKQLQTRAIMLDSEHSKLISTIRQTNEMVSSGKAPTGAGGGTDAYNAAASTSESEGDMLFVKGLDYRSVFEQCPAALGISALDGRILECNTEFQILLGFPREELLKQSLFNLVQNHQDIFRAMAQMLKNAEEPAVSQVSGMDGSTGTTGEGGGKAEGAPLSSPGGGVSSPDDNSSNLGIPPVSEHRFWTGPVTSKQNVKLLMNITLTLGDNGTPKFFSCAVTNTT